MVSPSERIIEEVACRLRNRLDKRLLTDITWAYRGGVLVLRGRLPSFFLKQTAQVAVSGIEGIRRLVNHIEVVRAESGTGRDCGPGAPGSGER
jgi:hypothetical protein